MLNAWLGQLMAASSAQLETHFPNFDMSQKFLNKQFLHQDEWYSAATYEAPPFNDENLHGQTNDTDRRLSWHNATTSLSRRNAVPNMKILIIK